MFETLTHDVHEAPAGQCHRYRVHVPHDAWYFRGHFDGNPVLPGVAQLNDLVLARLHQAWPQLGALRGATRVKFQRVIRPGEDLEVELLRKPEAARVRFKVTADGQACSSGTLRFEGDDR